jgi:hypothetical protein
MAHGHEEESKHGFGPSKHEFRILHLSESLIALFLAYCFDLPGTVGMDPAPESRLLIFRPVHDIEHRSLGGHTSEDIDLPQMTGWMVDAADRVTAYRGTVRNGPDHSRIESPGQRRPTDAQKGTAPGL